MIQNKKTTEKQTFFFYSKSSKIQIWNNKMEEKQNGTKTTDWQWMGTQMYDIRVYLLTQW